MKLVVDSVVFVSGVFFAGPPHRILEAWRLGNIQLLVSPAILEEYERVGEKLEARFGKLAFAPVMALVLCNATVVDAPPLLEPVCADPDDDKFIACALAANCTTIVSGDHHLLDVNGHAGLEMITPRAFLDRWPQISG